MSAPYTDSRYMIDGAAEVIIKDLTAISCDKLGVTTTWYVGTDPALQGIRAGDLVMVSGGTTVCRVDSVTATIINVADLRGATVPVTTDVIHRVGACVGGTQGGVELTSQTTVKERNIDQVLDPVSIKGDKRSSSLKVPMTEIMGLNIKSAFALGAAAIVVAGTKTTVKVGNSSTTLNTDRLMVLGTNENSQKVTLVAAKVVNSGSTSLKFAQDNNAVLNCDYKLISDSSRPAGEELFTLIVDTDHDLNQFAA